MSEAALPPVNPGAAFWELAGVELRLLLRSAGFRTLIVLAVLCVVLAEAAQRYGPVPVLGLGPVTFELVRGPLTAVLPLLLPPVVCGVAVRENRLQLSEVVLSKPPASAALVWAKLFGVYGAVLVLLLIATLAGLAAQPFFFHGEVAVGPTLLGGLRVALPLLFITGLSLSLALFARSGMVAGLVMAFPIGVAAGSTYLIPALRFTQTPYHLAYGLLGLALVAAVAGWWEGGREPERPMLRRIAPVAALLVAALGAGGISAIRWRGWTLDPDPAHIAWAEAAVKKGVLATAPLPTLEGRPLRLERRSGRPLVLVVWSTAAPDTATEAAALERAWRAAGSGAVDFQSVCVTGDPVQAADCARAAGLRGPVIWNPAPLFEQATGIAAALGMESVPMVAAAVLIRADGTVAGPAAVSQAPDRPRGGPPRRDWERRIVELGTTAFRQMAEERR